MTSVHPNTSAKMFFYRLGTAKIPIQHEYFAPGHGKSLMDGEGAVVKSHVSNLVKSLDCQVQNAEDFVSACKTFNDPENVHEQHINKKSPRTVLLVNDQKDLSAIQSRRVPNSRKLFSIRNIPGKPGLIEGRNLTCHCEGCAAYPRTTCDSSAHVDHFVKYNLMPPEGKKGRTCIETDQPGPSSEAAADRADSKTDQPGPSLEAAADRAAGITYVY